MEGNIDLGTVNKPLPVYANRAADTRGERFLAMSSKLPVRALGQVNDVAHSVVLIFSFPHFKHFWRQFQCQCHQAFGLLKSTRCCLLSIAVADAFMCASALVRRNATLQPAAGKRCILAVETLMNHDSVTIADRWTHWF